MMASNQKGYTMRLNRDVELAVEIINKQIDTLTTWGIRREAIATRGYKIQWSNNGSYWWRWYSSIPANYGWLDLDANELFISGHTKRTLELALPLLKWHPLFWTSYEAQNNLGV